jgi:hypothetical protein
MRSRQHPILLPFDRLLPAALTIGLLLPLAGCSSTDATTTDAGATFTAYQSTFQDFRSWSSFTFDAPAIPGSPHLVAGVRTEYLNHCPPAGATEFPVGTIIVKEFDSTPVALRQVFAMVKVGGGYDSQGAVNWEWYELQNNADGSVTILWNGAVAPPGEPYADTPISCNQCHVGGKQNDYVQAAALQLSALESSRCASILLDGGAE